MITVPELVEIFTDKLTRTGSLDAALTKVCWVAYKQGYEDGTTTPEVELTPPKWASMEIRNG